MSKDRIWSDNANQSHYQVDKVRPDIAAMQMFTTDLKKEEKPVELTRMQRKMNRIFGSGQATSKLFIGGFQMGAMVGGAFGGVIGIY